MPTVNFHTSQLKPFTLTGIAPVVVIKLKRTNKIRSSGKPELLLFCILFR